MMTNIISGPYENIINKLIISNHICVYVYYYLLSFGKLWIMIYRKLCELCRKRRRRNKHINIMSLGRNHSTKNHTRTNRRNHHIQLLTGTREACWITIKLTVNPKLKSIIFQVPTFFQDFQTKLRSLWNQNKLRFVIGFYQK